VTKTQPRRTGRDRPSRPAAPTDRAVYRVEDPRAVSSALLVPAQDAAELLVAAATAMNRARPVLRHVLLRVAMEGQTRASSAND
jgi:hypothetical protein